MDFKEKASAYNSGYKVIDCLKENQRISNF